MYVLYIYNIFLRLIIPAFYQREEDSISTGHNNKFWWKIARIAQEAETILYNTNTLFACYLAIHSTKLRYTGIILYTTYYNTREVQTTGRDILSDEIIIKKWPPGTTIIITHILILNYYLYSSIFIYFLFDRHRACVRAIHRSRIKNVYIHR